MCEGCGYLTSPHVTYIPPVKPGSPIHITASEFYEIAKRGDERDTRGGDQFQRSFQRSIKAHSN